eukprot:jgi/Hompol1/5761/HPOL_002792-RA
MAASWSTQLAVLVDPSLSGDRMLLPPTALDELLLACPGGQLPSPLTFRLSLEASQIATETTTTTTTTTNNDPSSLVTHGAVRQFTAADGTVCISGFLATALGIPVTVDPTTATPVLSITLVTLPKSTHAKLVPLNINYLIIPDIRSALESLIRLNHTTLTVGEVITLKTLHTTATSSSSSSPEVFDFRIAELKPADACLCIDTDLSVDIEAGDIETAERAVRRKFLGPSDEDLGEHHGILVWNSELGRSSDQPTLKGSLGYPIYLKMKRPAGITKLSLVATPAEGDFDCFVSLQTDHPSLLDHDFFDVETGSSRVAIDFDSVSQKDIPWVFVAIVPCSPSVAVSVHFEIDPNSNGQIVGGGGSSSGIAIGQLSAEVDAEMETCPNCDARVPSMRLQMHRIYCERNNVKCPKCSLVLRKDAFASHWHCEACDKVNGSCVQLFCELVHSLQPTDYASKAGHVSEAEKHMARKHTPIVCECKESLYLPQMAHHRRFECPERLIICRFCHLRVRSGPLSRTAKDLYLGSNLGEHESECGARTIECIKCGRSVQLKDIQTHAQFHEFEKQRQRIAKLCSNVACSNFINEQHPNIMLACPTCFAPFWTSRHDPGNQKLLQKLVATYHRQLTVGCGHRETCWNPICVTSQHENAPRAPMDPNEAAVRAFELLQSSFAKQIQQPEHFVCVSDGVVARRRYLAHSLLTPMGFSEAWSVKALVESGDDVQQAATWLTMNAPRA